MASPEPFEYGVSDCAICALKASDSVTGCNLAELVSRLYSDEETASRLLCSAGGMRSAVVEIASQVGAQAISDGFDVGDVGIAGRSIAVYTGRGWAARSKTGLKIVPRVSHAFRPPRSATVNRPLHLPGGRSS